MPAETFQPAMRSPRRPLPSRVRRRALRLTTLAWVFGSVWATVIAGAPLTEFARGLGLSNFGFGVLSGIPFVATLISLPAVLLTERSGKRKLIFLISLYAQRLMWIPIALVPIWMIGHGRAMSSGVSGTFLALMFLMYAVGNVGGPAWTSWMADIVPDRSRGKYFSVRRQIGILSGIPAALLSGWLMDRSLHNGLGHAQLMSLCSIIFLWSTAFGVADIHCFHYVADVPKAPRRVKLLSAFSRPLKDRQFLWFGGFVATLVFAVSFMGQFVTLFLEEQVHASNIGTQMITLVAPMVAQLAVFSVWGVAADRMGKKPVLALAALGMVPVGLGWMAMTEHRIWLGYLLSALGGMLWAGVEIANLNLVLELSCGDDGQEPDSSFIAVNSVIINVAGFLGGMASGWIAQALAHMHWQPITGIKAFTFYDVLFALSAVMRLLAVLVFLPHLKEPKARPAREALRFMSANIYNNLFNAILQPLRMARIAAVGRAQGAKRPS